MNRIRNGISEVLSLKNNHLIVDYDITALSAQVSSHEARIDTAESDIFSLTTKIGAGITTSVTVMINPTPTYKILNFTDGILTSVV